MDFNSITMLENHRNVKSSTIVIAGADDQAALGVVQQGRKWGLPFVLVGLRNAIEEVADRHELSLGGCEIVTPDGLSVSEDAEKAVCRTAARLCSEGQGGVLMKGHVGTAAFTRSILDRSTGLCDEASVLSHVGLFADPRIPEEGESTSRHPFLLSDAAINISPDLETKKKILGNVVSVARALGVEEPRIALLAPVEKVSPKIPSTLDARDLAEWVNSGALGPAVAEGPMGPDIAASVTSAAIKGYTGRIPGKADIYFAPNLEGGNFFYKVLTVFAGARAAGILAGARVPVVLTSRSDSMEVKLASLGFALGVAGL